MAQVLGPIHPTRENHRKLLVSGFRLTKLRPLSPSGSEMAAETPLLCSLSLSSLFLFKKPCFLNKNKRQTQELTLVISNTRTCGGLEKQEVSQWSPPRVYTRIPWKTDSNTGWQVLCRSLCFHSSMWLCSWLKHTSRITEPKLTQCQGALRREKLFLAC